MRKSLLVLVLALAGVAKGAAQTTPTITTPDMVRTDTSVSSHSTVTLPPVYDSVRAASQNCVQIRVGGVTQKAVCKSKTGPWTRHVITPPAPTPGQIGRAHV